MSRITDFLETLSDHELTYFAKYKVHTYMRESQEEIRNFLKERNITDEKIKALDSRKGLYAKTNQIKICPRCGSKKRLINNVLWTDNFAKAGLGDDIATMDAFVGRTTHKDEIICNVCDYWLQDPNNRGPKGQGKKRNSWSFWGLFTRLMD